MPSIGQCLQVGIALQPAEYMLPSKSLQGLDAPLCPLESFLKHRGDTLCKQTNIWREREIPELSHGLATKSQFANPNLFCLGWLPHAISPFYGLVVASEYNDLLACCLEPCVVSSLCMFLCLAMPRQTLACVAPQFASQLAHTGPHGFYLPSHVRDAQCLSRHFFSS